jgi:hypothetical protein
VFDECYIFVLVQAVCIYCLHYMFYSCRQWEIVKNLLQKQELSIMMSVAQRKQFFSIPKTVIQRISPELVIR